MLGIALVIAITLASGSLAMAAEGVSAASARTIVVNNRVPHASDKNDGTEGSPLSTIQAASERAQPGDVILVHAGIYREWINPPSGGESEDKRIVYRAAPGDEVSLRGSERVTSWVDQGNGTWKVTITNSFFGGFNPFSINLSGSWLRQGKELHLGGVYLDQEAYYEQRMVAGVQKKEKTWYAEVDGKTTTITANFGGANPNERVAEINVRECVIFPEKTGLKYITIEGFDIRHAAANWAPPDALQKGAVGPHLGYRWVIQNCTITHARCSGISLGASPPYVWQGDFQPLPDFNTVGHHLILSNHISRCGQAGIVGAVGCAGSIVEHNVIEEISYLREFGGAETAAIKFHLPVNVIIRHNLIRGVYVPQTKSDKDHLQAVGIWFDWGGQNARITGNTIYNCEGDGVIFEINHGPILCDNNVFVGVNIQHFGAEATVYAHNLFYQCRFSILKDPWNRNAPFYKPHSLIRAGGAKMVNTAQDMKWYNNIFVGRPGLVDKESLTAVDFPPKGKAYDYYKKKSVSFDMPGFVLDGNVYLDGAGKSKHDKNGVIDAGPVHGAFAGDASPLTLSLTLGNSVLGSFCSPVTSKGIAIFKIPNMAMETQDGKPLDVTADYYGNAIKASKVLPGPFQDVIQGKNTFTLWPRGSNGSPRNAR